jgi:hypothetical protein
MDASTIAALKEKPEQTITLYRDKATWQWKLVLCVAFAALGGVIVRAGEPAGWFLIALAFIGLLIEAAQYDTFLRIEAEAFISGNYHYLRRFEWQDVEAISIVRRHGRRRIAWRLRDEAVSQSFRAKRPRPGIDGILPDNFGIDLEELREIFEQRRLGAAAARMQR